MKIFAHSVPILSTIFTTIYAASQSDCLMDDMIQWVREEGGFFNGKLEIRRIEPTDPASYFGVFAKTDIDPRENLMNIPKSCYIHIFDQVKDTGTGEGWSETDYQHNECLLSHKLMEEIKLGERSRYAPYIAYLQTQKPGQIPVNWSIEGKDLLRKMLVPGSDSVDWIDLYYKDSCINPDDAFVVHMMEMTVQRGFDTALIPIWDMVNHDNGRLNTENNSMYDKEGLKVQAGSRKIKAGEEIFATYDMCVDCGGEEADYTGTPEILRDFGFVEGYPHRWYFEERDIWFVVKEEEGADELQVHWDPEQATTLNDDDEDDDEDDELDVEDILYLQEELNRLIKVGKRELSSGYTGRLPLQEWRVIVNYYDAARNDLKLAIKKAVSELKPSKSTKHIFVTPHNDSSYWCQHHL